MDKKYWLVKTEPTVFSIEDLKKNENKTTFWDGVRNYQARNYMRDDMKKGDFVLFYHSNTENPAVVGYCKVVKEGYPDFTAFDPDSKHYDAKSKKENPAWYMVDIKLEQVFKKPVLLNDIKSDPLLKNMKLVQKGNRLSVMPVTEKEFGIILEKSGK